MDELETMRTALVDAANWLQRLTFLLEERGVLRPEDVAYVAGEGPKPLDPGLGTTSQEW